MIYADNAATMKISDLALEQMLPFLNMNYGNAASQYSIGVKAKRAMELARSQVAIAINAKNSEIIFTSGGSEANSWVLRSVLDSYSNEPIHIVTSAVEHPSVLNACRALEKKGASVTYLPVNGTGRVSADDVKNAITPFTRLVSIILANNEIGTIQPLEEIGRLMRDKGILFHTDAVQAVGHIPVDVRSLNVDFLTASAHKFGGAKGTGILYKRAEAKLTPLIFGGEQEQGFRAGTENVAGIVAAGFALEESLSEMDNTAPRLIAMREATIEGIKRRIPFVKVNGNDEHRLPGIINLAFTGASGESLMHLLDLKGICVSTSSACAAAKEVPPHVLLALGLSEQDAKSAIRISYGKYNKIDEVSVIVAAVCDAYEKIRKAGQSIY